MEITEESPLAIISTSIIFNVCEIIPRYYQKKKWMYKNIENEKWNTLLFKTLIKLILWLFFIL